MKNKQHEYILRAFLEASVPTAIRLNAPDLMYIDSVLGGYCTQLIKQGGYIVHPPKEIISKTEKSAFSDLINRSVGSEKSELVIYYRLLRLVESVLMQY